MEKEQLISGATYRVRLTDGNWTNAIYKYEHKTSWLRARTMTHYVFTNCRTGRDVEIKSRVRIKEASGLHTPSVPIGFNQERP